MTKLNPDTDSKKINTETINARYQRANHLMQGLFSNRIVKNDTVFPVWIGSSNRFWYVRDSTKGAEYRLVDAEEATNTSAFDHQQLAVALGDAAKQQVDPNNLPIAGVGITVDPVVVTFQAFDKHWCFDSATGCCTEIEKTALSDNDVASPDGRYITFAKNHNIWLRNTTTGEEEALTTDGEAANAYGAVPTGWGAPVGTPKLQVKWSPDTRFLLVVQLDTRGVKTLPVVHYVPEEGVRPTLTQIPLAYPGDEIMESQRLHVIDVNSGARRPILCDPIPATRFDIIGYLQSDMAWWTPDSRLVYFFDVDRYYQSVRLLEADAETGSCRIIINESSDTYVNLSTQGVVRPTYLALPESEEILWYSERTGTGHLYRYDLKTSELKGAVTSEPGWVRNIIRYIPERREVFLQMAGQEAGKDPYYRNLVRVNVDTGEITPIATSDKENRVVPGDEDYDKLMMSILDCPPLSCGVSPDGNFAVVTESRADTIPLSYLIDRDGKKRLDLETVDISGLPKGWQWPEPVKLKAADGSTDIYGLVFRPSNFDPNKSWPIICDTWTTTELPWVSKGAFSNGALGGHGYWHAAALAELGFIVVQVDGRGSAGRERTFLDKSYGNYANASHIDDQAAAIRQLADRYPYIDLSKVGASALGCGGTGAVQGLLKHPDLFKVGVTIIYHDERLTSAPLMGNRYVGPSPLDETQERPENLINQLEGKLLMMVGMLDTAPSPAATFRLVEALQKANKDFDMVMLPNLGHPASSYFVRRGWDYFVRHLQGVEPPKEFKLSIPAFGDLKEVSPKS